MLRRKKKKASSSNKNSKTIPDVKHTVAYKKLQRQATSKLYPANNSCKLAFKMQVAEPARIISRRTVVASSPSISALHHKNFTKRIVTERCLSTSSWAWPRNVVLLITFAEMRNEVFICINSYTNAISGIAASSKRLSRSESLYTEQD